MNKKKTIKSFFKKSSESTEPSVSSSENKIKTVQYLDEKGVVRTAKVPESMSVFFGEESPYKLEKISDEEFQEREVVLPKDMKIKKSSLDKLIQGSEEETQDMRWPISWVKVRFDKNKVGYAPSHLIVTSSEEYKETMDYFRLVDNVLKEYTDDSRTSPTADILSELLSE